MLHGFLWNVNCTHECIVMFRKIHLVVSLYRCICNYLFRRRSSCPIGGCFVLLSLFMLIISSTTGNHCWPQSWVPCPWSSWIVMSTALFASVHWFWKFVCDNVDFYIRIRRDCLPCAFQNHNLMSWKRSCLQHPPVLNSVEGSKERIVCWILHDQRQQSHVNYSLDPPALLSLAISHHTFDPFHR